GLRVRSRLYLGAAARDQDARHRARRHGPAVDPRHEALAAERAPLRRAAGPEQGGNRREARRGAGEDLAPQLRHPSAAAAARRPPLQPDDERYLGTDRRYADLKPGEMPLSESLKDTVARFLPYWHETIAPTIAGGTRVLIAAHGNSLRALVKYLDDVSDSDIV